MTFCEAVPISRGAFSLRMCKENCCHLETAVIIIIIIIIFQWNPRGGSSLHCFQVDLEFGNVGFCGGRKTGVPGRKTLGAGTRTNNKLNPHMTPSPGIELGSHWWEAAWEANAQPLRHPYSPNNMAGITVLISRSLFSLFMYSPFNNGQKEGCAICDRQSQMYRFRNAEA